MNHENPVPGTDRDLKIRFGTTVRSPEPVFWTPDGPDQAFGSHIAILGDPGTGKTQFTKSLVTQLNRRRPHMGVLVFDYQGDYSEKESEFLHVTGARSLKMHKLPVNPFSLSGGAEVQQKHVHTAMAFADALANAYGLSSLQKSTLVQAVMSAYTAQGITSDPETWTKGPPTFQQVYAEYCARPAAQRGDSLAAAMETLEAYDLFDEDPTESMADTLRGVVVLDMSGYPQELRHLATAVSLSRIARSRQPEAQKLMILVDEVDGLLDREFPVLGSLLEEGEQMGIGMLLSIRDPQCLHRQEALGSRIGTWVIHHTAELKKADAEYLLGLPPHDPALEGLFQQLRRLEKHHSLVRLGKGIPVHMADLPFYQICQDTRESYLLEKKPQEPVEDLFAGMPMLDTGFIASIDLEQDAKLEPFEL